MCSRRSMSDSNSFSSGPSHEPVKLSGDFKAERNRDLTRLGLLELRQATNGARRRAALHAALDLAERYGGDSSLRFVRGVLGRAAGARRPANPSGDPSLPGVDPGHLNAGGGER